MTTTTTMKTLVAKIEAELERLGASDTTTGPHQCRWISVSALEGYPGAPDGWVRVADSKNIATGPAEDILKALVMTGPDEISEGAGYRAAWRALNGRDLYCKPWEAGLASESRAVGRSIAKVLNALDDVNRNVCEGRIVDDVEALARLLRDELRREGWRVTTGGGNSWRVLPPKR